MGVDTLSYFSFQPVLHDWYNKGRGMCHPVCGMVHIKEPLLLIGKSSICDGSRFPLSLRHMGYSFRLATRVLLYASFHRQDNTYHGLCCTSRGAVVGTRNSCRMVHIKEPLLLIGKSRQCSGSRFPLSLSEWYFAIIRRHITVNKMC